MSYSWWIIAVATDKDAGNQLASLVAAESGDYTAFNTGVPLYPQGTTFTPTQDGPMTINVPSQAAVAWMVPVAVQEQPYLLAAEYASDGPYPQLNGLGIADEQVAGLKLSVTVQAGLRSEIGNTESIRSFVESLGYVME